MNEYTDLWGVVLYVDQASEPDIRICNSIIIRTDPLIDSLAY